MHRPHFTYEAENREAEDALEEDELDGKYSEEFQNNLRSGIILQPAKDHHEWTWTILWAGFKNFSDYRRRSNYCDPDRFSMHIYNDFHGWGLQELAENQVRVLWSVLNLANALIYSSSKLRSRRPATKRSSRCGLPSVVLHFASTKSTRVTLSVRDYIPQRVPY